MNRVSAYIAAGCFGAKLRESVQCTSRSRCSPRRKKYAACHDAPGPYTLLKNWMARMTWVPLPAIDDPVEVRNSLAQYGSTAVILKDFVKSQAAGYWSQACYISDASDQEHVGRVVGRFRELQGDSLVGRGTGFQSLHSSAADRRTRVPRLFCG